MIKSVSLFAAFAGLSLSFSPIQAQEDIGEAPPSTPTFNGKPIDQLTADEVLKLVRYSYTLYDRDFEGQLRLGFADKIPFILSLKPDSIRFIFNDPSQVILLDTRDNKFALYEGIGGKDLVSVNPAKYDDQIRGTDSTYDDLSMRFLYWPGAKIAGLDRYKNRDCWIVRVVNPQMGVGAYATVDVWIDKASGGMLKMKGYNRQGRPIRHFEVLHGKKFGDIWMIDEMRIETIDPDTGSVKSSTRMQIKSVAQ